jgi:hypothetical protein
MPSTQPEAPTAARKRSRSRQLHFWVTDLDYDFISLIAAENEETLAATLRLIIRTARKARLEQESIRRKSPPATLSTGSVPIL